MKSTRRRSARKPSRRIRFSTLAALLIVAVLFAFVAYSLIPSQQTESQKPATRAAIVDQLSMLYPGREFTKPAENILHEAGLSVDVYGPESVTVDLYAWIPSAGYGLIIFRVHGGVNQQIQGNPVGLYTSEPYSELGYPKEQLADMVGMGRAYDQSDTVVFAVTPKFIKERSAADYPGTIVILMGCYGLFSTDLPQAFIDRGASVVIGWKGLVGLEHTDKATLVLLEAIVLDKLRIQDSVDRTLDRVGPDPESKSILAYYPETKGDLVFSELHPSGFFMVSSMAPTSARKEMVSELTSGRTC